MIRVVNKHKDTPNPKARQVYIGRPSLFGNPFVIGRDGDRDEVVRKFRAHFQERMLHDGQFHRAVMGLSDELGDIELVCFCAPSACHGDVYKEYLDGTRT